MGAEIRLEIENFGNSDDGWATLWMLSLLLSCTLKNGFSGKFYVYFATI